MGNRYINLLQKGIDSLHQNGVGYTLHKVSMKIRQHLRSRHVKTNYSRFFYSTVDLQRQKRHKFNKNIKFSILTPLYNTPQKFLREMIESVLAQTYNNWELCLVDGSDDEHGNVGTICREYMANDTRIKYKKLDKNLGIAGNSNACGKRAAGDYICLLDHDDLLSPAALYENMCVLCSCGADIIYSDEATFIKKVTNIVCANFKPDFAIDNLRGNNYICHLLVFSKTLWDKCGGFRSGYDGAQDHDLILRLTEATDNIVHIPKLLYFWRSHPGSTSAAAGAKSYAAEAGCKAVHDHLARLGIRASVSSTKACPTMYRIEYELPSHPLISIIIPTKNHCADLRSCIDSILKLTTYSNYEILIVDNGSTEDTIIEYYNTLKADNRISIFSWNHVFNYPAINNYAVKYARGEYIVLLNNDTKIITPAWLEEMLMYAQRKDVGAAGAKLYYPDDTIQHAGVVIGIGGVGDHVHKLFSRYSPGYMGRLCYAQDFSAVTAACIMIPSSLYKKLGGLDEGFKIAFNDVDFCMRIRQAGYLIVFTPFAELYHCESKSRGYEDTPEKQARFADEVDRFQQKWHDELAKGDPYYNPNLALDRNDFSAKF